MTAREQQSYNKGLAMQQEFEEHMQRVSETAYQDLMQRVNNEQEAQRER